MRKKEILKHKNIEQILHFNSQRQLKTFKLIQF